MIRYRTVLMFFLIAATACHRNTRAAAPPPATPIPAALQNADTAFDSGDFSRAARAYESYLQLEPDSKDLDRILFRFAVAQSMSGVQARNEASSDAFNRLIRDFPQSPFVAPAKMILALRADLAHLQEEEKTLLADQKTQLAEQKARDDKIKQLSDELDKLKKIDLDRRRTP